jgi:hypothetical protein
MSIASMKDAFNHAVRDKSIICEGARLYYTADRQKQILEFDIIRPADGMRTTVVTDPMPMISDPDAAATAAAATAAKNFTKA